MSETELQLDAPQAKVPLYTTRTKKSFLVIEFTTSSLQETELLKDLQDELMTLIDHPERSHVLLDLKGVRDVSSKFLGIIIALHTKLAKRRGKLALCSLNHKLHELMALTRLERLVTIVPSVHDVVERDCWL